MGLGCANAKSQTVSLSRLAGQASTPTLQVRSYVPVPSEKALPVDTFEARQSTGLVLGVRATVELGSHFGVEGSVFQRWSTRSVSPLNLGPDVTVHLLQGTLRLAWWSSLSAPVALQLAGGVSFTHFPESTYSNVGGILNHSTAIGGSIGVAALWRVTPHLLLTAGLDDAVYRISFSSYPTINPTFANVQSPVQHDLSLVGGVVWRP
jgi:hypothetical protein